MDISYWLSLIFPSFIGGISGVGICLYKTGLYKKTIDELEKNVKNHADSISKNEIEIATIKTYERRILIIEGYFSKIIEKKMTEANSPLSLTVYAKQLFEDIQFYKVFDMIKDELLKDLEKHNLRTKYDVQEMARYVFLTKRENPLLDPLKKQVFEKGKNLDEILGGAFIPLRDYYLEKHPEITD